MNVGFARFFLAITMLAINGESRAVDDVSIDYAGIYDRSLMSSEKLDDEEVAHMLRVWADNGGGRDAMQLICSGLYPVAKYVDVLVDKYGGVEAAVRVFEYLHNLIKNEGLESRLDDEDIALAASMLVRASTNRSELCTSAPERENVYLEAAIRPVVVKSSGMDEKVTVMTSVYANNSLVQSDHSTLLVEGRMEVADPTNRLASSRTSAGMTYVWTSKVLDYSFRPHAPRFGKHFWLGVDAATESNAAADDSSIGSFGLAVGAACRGSTFDIRCSSDESVGNVIWDYSVNLSTIDSDDGVSSKLLGLDVGYRRIIKNNFAYCRWCFYEIGSRLEYGNSDGGDSSEDRLYLGGYFAIEKQFSRKAFSLRFELGHVDSEGLRVREEIEAYDGHFRYGSISLVYRSPGTYYTIENDGENYIPSFSRAASYSGSGRGGSQVNELQ